MLTFHIESLRNFLKNTAYIAKNNLLPVLGNIKLYKEGEQFYAVKNNLKSVCIHPVQGRGEGGPVLLDFTILTALLNVAQGDDLNIEELAGNLVLTYSIGKKEARTELQSLPADDFPVPANIPAAEEGRLLPPAAIDSMATARYFTSDKESTANFQYVALNGDNISAFEGAYFYVSTGHTDLTPTLLSREACDVVVALGSVTHASTSQSDCFYTDAGAVYIFAKCEYKPHKLEAVLKGLGNTDGKAFTSLKEDWVTFCNLANAVTESAVALCTVSPTGLFTMEDGNWNRKQDLQADITGELDEFRFNSRSILPPLKAIPIENWNCKTNQHFLIINSDKEYFTFIGMQK
jgi:hypothetical protein